MHLNLLIGLSFIIFSTCSGHIGQPPVAAGENSTYVQQGKGLIDPEGNTINTRFLTPESFTRVGTKENSFQDFLRTLPLKPHNTKVKLYDGRIKENHGVYCAVADLGIGTKDLHQCADAVMRLRAEYLYEQEQYEKIHFNFTNGFRADYSEWMKGKRIQVDGNNARWIQSVQPSNSYSDFWKYMETIFTYAGTLSLSGELQPTVIENIRIGDVFIRGGSPGHAVIGGR